MIFLVNLMFYKLDKFDGPIFLVRVGGLYTGKAYIRNVNWVLYLGRGVYLGGNGLYTSGVLTGFYSKQYTK